MTAASMSAMSFVLPMGAAAPIGPAPAAPRHRKHGQSSAVEMAARPEAGILAFAPPPGTIGVRTLCAALWVLFGARLVFALLTYALS